MESDDKRWPDHRDGFRPDELEPNPADGGSTSYHKDSTALKWLKRILVVLGIATYILLLYLDSKSK